MTIRFVEQQKDVWRTLLGKSKTSVAGRKRAWCFLFALCLSLCVLVVSLLHFVAAWVSSGLLQLVMIIFTMVYVLNIADCRDKCLNVLECERAVNPLMEIYVGLRAVQTLHAVFFLRSALISAFFALAFLLILWRISRGTVFVDATSVWREIGRLERESYFHLVMDILLIVAYIVCLVIAIVTQYGD